VFGATRTIDAGLPNAGQLMNLTSMPSDAVVGPTFTAVTLEAGKIYEITTLPTNAEELVAYKAALLLAGNTTLATEAEIKVGSTFEVISATDIDLTKAVYTTLKANQEYKVSNLNGTNGLIADATPNSDAEDIAAGSAVNANLIVGSEIKTIANDITSLGEGIEFQKTTTDAAFRQIDASKITRNIEAVQKLINTGRVQAGSQYAALESAVIYTTDLTAQYELGYNTVHDVNFSMETAHLAKNQILQQAATAMLAQANQGQQGLLQLIQG
jgi:flagellin